MNGELFSEKEATEGLRVLHVDRWLIVVDKPAGLLSVTGRGPEGEDCVHARVLRRWDDALVVHRLDMATSGLMLFARGPEAQRALSGAFERRQVRKRYQAIVSGCPAGHRSRGLGTGLASVENGTAPDRPRASATDGWSVIDLPLAADWPNRPRQKVDFATGRPSTTRWRELGDASGPWGIGTRLELEPVTGRSHQLRVHLLSIGHPIVGDALYAPPPLVAASPRLLLHAAALVFDHPGDGRRRSFGCPPPF
jgi:tRNA pseudouridine32 synthase/23S rRNA pseudouridine746 synthase